MNQRWYDQNPRMSLAIDLMQNTSFAHRQRVADYLEAQLATLAPDFAEQFKQAPKRWAFLQQRKTLDFRCWRLIECLREVPDDDCERLAMGVVHYLSRLEHDAEWEHPIVTDWHRFGTAAKA